MIEDAIRRLLAAALEPLCREVAALRVAVEQLHERVGAHQPGDYLSAEQAAAIAGVEARTIREWAGSGKLCGHRAGRLLRVRRDELERYLAAGRPPSTSDIRLQQLAKRARGSK